MAEQGEVDPDILAATRKTLESLRTSGTFPSAQLDVLSRGLDALVPASGIVARTRRKEHAEAAGSIRDKSQGNELSRESRITKRALWGRLPDEILVQIAAAAMMSVPEKSTRLSSLPSAWWHARTVCQQWKR